MRCGAKRTWKQSGGLAQRPATSDEHAPRGDRTEDFQNFRLPSCRHETPKTVENVAQALLLLQDSGAARRAGPALQGGRGQSTRRRARLATDAEGGARGAGRGRRSAHDAVVDARERARGRGGGPCRGRGRGARIRTTAAIRAAAARVSSKMRRRSWMWRTGCATSPKPRAVSLSLPHRAGVSARVTALHCPPPAGVSSLIYLFRSINVRMLTETRALSLARHDEPRTTRGGARGARILRLTSGYSQDTCRLLIRTIGH